METKPTIFLWVSLIIVNWLRSKKPTRLVETTSALPFTPSIASPPETPPKLPGHTPPPTPLWVPRPPPQGASWNELPAHLLADESAVATSILKLCAEVGRFFSSFDFEEPQVPPLFHLISPFSSLLKVSQLSPDNLFVCNFSTTQAAAAAAALVRPRMAAPLACAPEGS
jgi:hypothetical protein